MKGISVGLHNRFDITVTDAATGEVKQTAQAENIILNRFWTRFLSTSNSTCLNAICVGSGTATPLATDTVLTTYVTGKNCSTDAYDDSTFMTDGIVKRKRSIRIEAGEQVGKTISEVGFSADAGGFIMTKALITDANGNPISIVIGPSDVVDVFATFFAKVPVGMANGSSDIYITDSLSGWMRFMVCYGGAPSSENTGYYRGPRTPKVITPHPTLFPRTPGVSWDIANKKITVTIPNLTAAEGNVGGFETLCTNSVAVKIPRAGFAQHVIIKEVIGTGNGSTKDFKCEFGRILNNGTAKLYVNDVEVPATFDYNMPPPTDYYSGWVKKKSASSNEVIIENEHNSKFGIDTILFGRSTCYASADLNTWHLVGNSLNSIGSSSPTSTVAYKYYKYFKFVKNGSYAIEVGSIASADALANLVIHADSAPASGATVALTYQPDCIAKTSSYVIQNVSIALTFNEYTP